MSEFIIKTTTMQYVQPYFNIIQEKQKLWNLLPCLALYRQFPRLSTLNNLIDSKCDGAKQNESPGKCFFTRFAAVFMSSRSHKTVRNQHPFLLLAYSFQFSLMSEWMKMPIKFDVAHTQQVLCASCFQSWTFLATSFSSSFASTISFLFSSSNHVRIFVCIHKMNAGFIFKMNDS